MTTFLITGATRGLGRETARQLVARGHVVHVGARDASRGRAVAEELGARWVRLDVVVNNAGIASPVLDGPETLRTLDTNVAGVVRVTQAALPLLRRSANPVIVNVSSALGSFTANHDPARPASHVPAMVYGASKAAVSMLTVQYARALPGIKVNAVEPGYTATELGGRVDGGRPVEVSAAVIVRMATIGPDGPTGTFAEDDGELGW